MRASRVLLLLPGVGLLVALGACSHRSLTIESEPPGARVLLDRTPVGTTPVTVPYRHGGRREILLLPTPPPPGGQLYRPAIVHHDSWRFDLDGLVIDGFAELLGTEDHPVVRVQLQPDSTQAVLGDPATRDNVLDALTARADQLRQRSRELFIDAPPLRPVPPPPGWDSTPPPDR